MKVGIRMWPRRPACRRPRYRRRWRARPSIRRCAAASKRPSGVPATCNLAARRLRSRHSNTIGLIVADIRNPFFTAISRSVEDLAYARGLRVILCNTDENPEKEEMYLRLMEEERVLGAICAPTRARPGRSGACGAVFR